MSGGEGICTDMRAVRKDYFLDHDHSCCGDQWDWERVVTAEQRNLAYLKQTVQKIWTDENGMASIRLDRPGVWLVKAVQIIPVIGRPQTIPGKPPALWQSYWASFLFEVPGS